MPNGTLAVTFQFEAGFEDSLDIPADDFSSPTAALARRRWLRDPFALPAVKWRALMRLNGSLPSNSDIHHPDCPQWGTRMWLARIEPDEPNHDKRTFECPQCDRAITRVVKYK